MNNKSVFNLRRSDQTTRLANTGRGGIFSAGAARILPVRIAPVPVHSAITGTIELDASGSGTAGAHLFGAETTFPAQSYLALKRLFDVIVSVIALGIFSVVLAVLSVIIKLDSPGPVFFSQDRVGMNRRRGKVLYAGPERRKILQPGRPFKVFKLRSMTVNAEANGPQWATKNDVRITRIGRVLRKTRLDEVPQFLNVLRGEMSLIGPRPERLVFVRQLEHEVPRYHERLTVLPGITGLAQVVNGYDDGVESVRRKVELDRLYIRRAGFGQDFKILIHTVGVVLKGEGAR